MPPAPICWTENPWLKLQISRWRRGIWLSSKSHSVLRRKAHLPPKRFKEELQVNSEPQGPTLAKKKIVRTRLHGIDLLLNPRLSKGTAFTEEERDAFGLHGLLPPHIGTLEDQRARRMRVLASRDTAFGKYSNMRDLQDNNETL